MLPMTFTMPLPVISFHNSSLDSPDTSGMLHCYVHIPFCRNRCSYCDFFLITREGFQEPFFRALREETRSRAILLEGRTIRSVHFGGGTPSLVDPRYLEAWLNQVAGYATFHPELEITLEANPEDLTPQSLALWSSIGVNRLSIGIQSYNSRKLHALGRDHDALCARRVTGEAMERFRNVSVDLICGVEGESSALWGADLDDALSFGLQHLSVYMLTVEPSTRLARDVSKGLVQVPGEDELASMYSIASERLSSSGFEHYEVSNFARVGCFSRYNMGCWQRESYLGFGPSAHSLYTLGAAEWRSANVTSLTRYIAEPRELSSQREFLSEKDRRNEQIFLSLRLKTGLDAGLLQRWHSFDPRIDTAVDAFRQRGWLDVTGRTLKVTRKGFLFADLIAEELLLG